MILPGNQLILLYKQNSEQAPSKHREWAFSDQAFYVDITKYGGDLTIAAWSASKLQSLETKAKNDEKTN